MGAKSSSGNTPLKRPCRHRGHTGAHGADVGATGHFGTPLHLTATPAPSRPCWHMARTCSPAMPPVSRHRPVPTPPAGGRWSPRGPRTWTADRPGGWAPLCEAALLPATATPRVSVISAVVSPTVHSPHACYFGTRVRGVIVILGRELTVFALFCPAGDSTRSFLLQRRPLCSEQEAQLPTGRISQKGTTTPPAASTVDGGHSR